jgi:hypothetical protein
MPNKTIYFRDASLWDQAKTLAGGEGLSSVIADLLADWVRRREALGNLSEFELWVGGRGHEEQHGSARPLFVGFKGRYIADNFGSSFEQMPKIHVYQTTTGALVVYRDWRDTAGREWGATYLRFQDFQSLQRHPTALQTTSIDAKGDLQEDLDIESEVLQTVADALGQRFVVRID